MLRCILINIALGVGLASLRVLCWIYAFFMTGMTDITSKVEGFEVGGVDYIPKPLQVEEVMARVRTHLTLYKLQHELEEQVAARTADLKAEIDARKRAQTDLREAHQLLERIFEQTHILVAYLDPDFNFVRVNRAYALADGREPAFFIGKQHFDLYPNPENEAIFRRVVETGKPHFEFAKPFEYAEYPERGVSYWDWSLMPVKDEAGEVVGLVLTLLDVTSRKRAEEALRESERNFAALAANANDGIAVVSGKGEILYVNQRAAEIMGYSTADLLIMHMGDLIYPDELPKQMTRLQKRLRGDPIPRQYETAVVRKDGHPVPLEVTAARTEWQGCPADMVILRDITRRRQTQEELQRHREHLEALVAERTQALRERIKALNCLYSISRLVEQSGASLYAILEGTVALLPPAWRYPDHTEAQIVLDDRVFRTKDFAEAAPWRQTADIVVNNESRGGIEVNYVDMHHHANAPFLKSERDLLNAVAERLGHIIERWEAEEALEERLRFETLLAELAVAFVHFSERTLEEEIGRWLQRTSELLHLDRCRLFELNAEMTEAHSLYGFASDGAVLPPFQVTREQLPHIFERITGKKPFVFSGRDSLPPEAELERAFFSVEDIAASLIVPLQEGTMALVAMRVDIEDALAPAYAEGTWPDDVVQQLHLIGEVLANALLRERAEQALRHQAEEQARHAEEQAMLYAITAAAAASFLEPEALLKAALDTMISALHADGGWVTLPGPTPDDPPYIAIWQGLPEPPQSNRNINIWQNCPAYNAFINGCEPQINPTSMDQCACIITQILEGTVGPLTLQRHISVPLCVGDHILGVLNVAWSTPGTRDLNRDLLRTIGQQIGIALRNAELYQQARQVDQLRALNTISTAANASLNLDTVLYRIIDLTCHTFDAEEGAILLWDSASQALVFATSLQRDQILKGRPLSPGQGIAGWVVQHNQAVRVNDVHRDPRWYEGVDADTGFTSRNLLCAPLIYRGNTTGVIEMLNKRQGAFTEDDLSLLEAVAAIAAANIENARLFAATRARAEELELLNKIGLTLSASLDPTEVMDTALVHIQRLFNASGAALVLTDAATGEGYFSQVRVGANLVDIPVRIPPGAGIAGAVLAQRRSILVEDVQKDPRFLAHLYQGPAQIRSTINTPLLTPDGGLGLIVVFSDQVGAYTPNDVQVLESLASMLAIALENARLYENLKTALHNQERAQTQLIHAEKMGALGRLAASIAHEINNPLQAIVGGMELATEEVDEKGDWAVVKEELRLASAEVERVADIVNRMREFYRPGRAGFQHIDLHNVIEDVLALSRKRLQHAHVSVERAWGLDVSEIQANEDQLKQVFLNLILNAVDAMSEGGTLHITTAIDQLQDSECRENRPAVRVEFSDTGAGIPQDVLPHIFEPFFTTKGSGTGLGLSISHSIIDAHNGTLTAASHVGLGTTFTLILPVAQPNL